MDSICKAIKASGCGQGRSTNVKKKKKSKKRDGLDAPLIHSKEKRYVFTSNEDATRSAKLSSMVVNGLHLEFTASGSFGRVESMKGGTVVKKTLFQALPSKVENKLLNLRHLDAEMTDGCKEVVLLRRINQNDPTGQYAPLLLGAKFDTYSNSTCAVSLVRELVMTSVGRSVSYWKDHDESLPVQTLLQQGLDALKFLHGIGIYHCDVSAGNVSYDRLRDRFRLIDFGQSTLSFPPGSREDGQPMTPLDEDLHPNAPYAVHPEAFLSDSCRESRAILHLIDPHPMEGSVFLGEQDLTTFPYRDISLVLSDCHRRRLFNDRYDVYSLGMVVVEMMGFDIYTRGFDGVSAVMQDFYYADVSKADRNFYTSIAMVLCRKLNRLRGGLAYNELEFWKEFVNNNCSIVKSLSEDEDTICDLDWAARIFGSTVTETVKSMIHPIPEFRNFGDYSLRQVSHQGFDDEEAHFHVSIPVYYKKQTVGNQHSSIVVHATWKLPQNDGSDDYDDDGVVNQGDADERDRLPPCHGRRLMACCNVGSVSFRRHLDLPDRVYVERIYVQPRYAKILPWLLTRALHKSYSLFSPQLRINHPVDLVILVANPTERSIVTSSFPRRVVETDKYHVQIRQWQIFVDEDGSKPVGHGRV